MKKADTYRETLSSLPDWDEYLLQESRLPGPRANLELAHVVAEAGDWALFQRYLDFDADKAPTNTPQEFLAFCGVLAACRRGNCGFLSIGQIQSSILTIT